MCVSLFLFAAVSMVTKQQDVQEGEKVRGDVRKGIGI